MKKFVSYIAAGIIGGAVSFGLMKSQLETNITIEETPQVVKTSNNVTPTNLPFDFVSASKKATEAVVQVKSSVSIAAANRQRNERSEGDQFDFFGFDELFGGRGFGPQQGSGSGVIIGENGLIVTNNHVVGIADDLLVTLSDGREYKATKIGTDKSTDLALIQIEGTNLPTLEFTDSDNLNVGEWVLAVGNPLGNLTSTVTAGIVSAIGRDIDIIKGKKAIEEFIQTDAAVNPGNSGGALVDAQGRLIGINTAIASGTGYYTGYSFAIPSNLVSRIVDEILENGGDIERAYLGLEVQDVYELLKNDQPVAFDYGVLINNVVNGSSAQYAGVLPGDIIINVNGSEIRDFDELSEALKFVKVGDTVRLRVMRDGNSETIPVKIRKAS
jgi:S1-C subfamily serine protease